MKSNTKPTFQALLILSLILNLALITAWLASPYGPLDQLNKTVEVQSHTDLELRADQIEELHRIESQFYRSRHDLCQELHGERRKLLTLLTVPGATVETVEVQRAKILAGQQQMLDLAVERLLAEKEVLDEEQFEAHIGLLRSRVRCSDSMTP